MNILFYLVPKRDVIYLCEMDSMRQALEKMEFHRYTSVPLITSDGKYAGTLTEGDILWEMKRRSLIHRRDLEGISLRQVCRDRYNHPVNINCDMEDLLMTALEQNFVPVIDDNEIFIGIVTRKSIMTYCYNKLKEYEKKESIENDSEK